MGRRMKAAVPPRWVPLCCPACCAAAVAARKLQVVYSGNSGRVPRYGLSR